jgi:CheY-like chemotaxis protein
MTEIVLIDDSLFDLTINEMVISKSLSKTCLKFTDPNAGYEFLKEKLESTNDQILLFLDLNMPEMNGWELLNLLHKCPKNILTKINVVILSNSNNPSDIENSKTYNIVENYAVKPLNETKLQSAILGINFD